MDPAEEIHDQERVDLIQLLGEILSGIPVSSSTWAFLWFADIERLRLITVQDPDMITRTLGANYDANNLARWATRDRRKEPEIASDISKGKRKLERRDPSPSKIPRPTTDSTPRGVKDASATKGAKPRKETTQGADQLQKAAKDACAQRDGEFCVLTGAGEPIEIAHIYADSLGEKDKSNSVLQAGFWRTLSFYWSPERVKTWKEAVLGEHGASHCANLISLRSEVHKLWGMARFALKPLQVSEDGRRMEVMFFWLKPGEFNKAVILADQGPPAFEIASLCAQKKGMILNCNTGHCIRSGDVFVWETEDPVHLPLPSFALLDMQWRMNRVLAISGAADVDEKELMDDDDSDEEGEESGGDGGGGSGRGFGD